MGFSLYCSNGPCPLGSDAAVSGILVVYCSNGPCPLGSDDAVCGILVVF